MQLGERLHREAYLPTVLPEHNLVLVFLLRVVRVAGVVIILLLLLLLAPQLGALTPRLVRRLHRLRRLLFGRVGFALGLGHRRGLLLTVTVRLILTVLFVVQLLLAVALHLPVIATHPGLLARKTPSRARVRW